MNREEALQILKQNLKNRNLVNHCIAAEVVMKRLAQHFGEDEAKWALAGLLHDIDYEETKDDPERHSAVGAEMLEQMGLPQDIVYAVKVHNERHGLPRLSLMDKALYATDPTTGLIVAGALIKPEKKLSAIDVDFLIKRMKEKSFARGANRDQIRSCEELGLSLEEFLGLSLEAMQGAADELGL
ncbi:metal dependent phosphohydrolase [Desulfotomaculum nigrificans CO-1-SRB]|uniref:Metal dependent phosphohydrolase n=1 Tax=Desulfotomaculum nigrificans (strain DSM 14880 / VKM B-2319 / CO-1-SRB) TaxID=868595 RepID=F6B4V8_DESCC|nr:HDIG domain-containing metalloprotein [Desulfotomaculum nigrificans]AEF95330.1 metal dependent phosphohydrolase [Desulfotomaculum nigrificans CO-1-SRB]